MLGINIAAARAQFPSAANAVHFDHASVGPISVRVSDAMQDVAAVHSATGFRNSWRDDIEHVRSLLATFVGSSPGNIAFTQNTSTGLSIAANGIDWRPGDNVVLPEREFPSNFYPWLNLEHRGVELRRVPAPDGHATIDAIASSIDSNTRVVTVSAVQYSNGHRYDLDALGEFCRRHGVLFVVDGTQSVGALTIDVERSAVDLLAVSSHKWMLGPPGIGFVHVSHRALEQIRADIVGWLSVREPFAFDDQLDLPDTADRYEPGTENVIGTVGLGAAVSLFLEHGTEHVENRVLALTDRICERLRRGGHEIVSPRAPRRTIGHRHLPNPRTTRRRPAQPAHRRRYQVRIAQRRHPVLTALLQRRRRHRHSVRRARIDQPHLTPDQREIHMIRLKCAPASASATGSIHAAMSAGYCCDRTEPASRRLVLARLRQISLLLPGAFGFSYRARRRSSHDTNGPRDRPHRNHARPDNGPANGTATAPRRRARGSVMDIVPGMAVHASDGPVGRVRDLIVDPVDGRVTHLVVETDRGDGRALLVPVGAIYPEKTVGHSRVVLLWTCADVVAAAPVDPAIQRKRSRSFPNPRRQAAGPAITRRRRCSHRRDGRRRTP